MPKTTEKKEEIVEVEKTELAESPKWEIAASDIDIPRFNIRQKSSEYDAGEFGDLVIDKSRRYPMNWISGDKLLGLKEKERHFRVKQNTKSVSLRTLLC